MNVKLSLQFVDLIPLAIILKGRISAFVMLGFIDLAKQIARVGNLIIIIFMY